MSRTVLDTRFAGSEMQLVRFLKEDRECRQIVLQCAGFDPGDAELIEFTARYYGKPDIVCRLADGRLAVIELCFELSRRHAFKDLAYVLDPASSAIAGIVWICDSVPPPVLEMLRHYAERFRLDRRISFEVLVPDRFDVAGPARFTFVPLLRDLRAGTSRVVCVTTTVVEQLTALCHSSLNFEMDTRALARLLGVSPTWVTAHAARSNRSLRLDPKAAPDRSRFRGADGRFLFDLDQVLTFIGDLETHVACEERHDVRSAPLPLVSARDTRIGADWLTIEMFRRTTPTRQHLAIKRRLGVPVAFFISSSARGYSLVWPTDRGALLRGQPSNDNW